MPIKDKANNAESDRRTETIVGLLVIGLSRKEIIQYCAEKTDPPWKLATRQIDAYIQKANKKLGEASNINIEKEIGLAVSRMEDLFKRNIGIQDYKTALATQKEKSELLGLKKQGPTIGDVNIHVKFTKDEDD